MGSMAPYVVDWNIHLRVCNSDTRRRGRTDRRGEASNTFFLSRTQDVMHRASHELEIEASLHAGAKENKGEKARRREVWGEERNFFGKWKKGLALEEQRERERKYVLKWGAWG